MSTRVRPTATYPNPFSKAYWKDAFSELKDTKMLVVTALMIALRIVLKPLAIPLGPQLSIQTAMLATALGAMIYGPVVAIPAAIISDTVGFMIYPTGDYFLPFVLTEIASTLFYALFLYRAKVTPTRVMLSRFCICFFVNVVLQQFIYAWWYVYIGNPEEAKETVLGIMTLTRILKNVCMFPIESVVLTLFLKFLVPVTRRMGLTHGTESEMSFNKKQVITLVCLVLVGVVSATGYLAYRYSNSSRSADYTAKESFNLINSLAKENKLPNMSIVLNGIDMSKKKYGYYYGYGRYGKYGRYGRYSSSSSYRSYGAYGAYGNYSNSHYGDKNDTSVKR